MKLLGLKSHKVLGSSKLSRMFQSTTLSSSPYDHRRHRHHRKHPRRRYRHHVVGKETGNPNAKQLLRRTPQAYFDGRHDIFSNYYIQVYEH